MSKIKLYRFPLSGHSHRAEVFLSLLGIEAELVDVDLGAGAHKQPDFVVKNPFGQVPVLEDGEVTLWDSNAILVYLASRYDPQRQWLPAEPVVASRVQRFLSLAAGPLAYGPASARLVTVFGAGLDQTQAIDAAHGLLKVLEGELADQVWLVGEQPTIADVAMYTYTAHAPEGNVSLADYPAVRAWLARFERLPGFLPMQASAVGLAA